MITSIFYSDDMQARTEKASFDFKQSKGYGTTEVIANGHFGNLKSEGFEFYTDKNILVFTGKTYITVKEESLKDNK